MTYNESITYLESEAEALEGMHKSTLVECLYDLANGTEAERIEASEDLVNLYPLVTWLNSEMAFEAIQAIYMTVNPNLPPRPTK